MNGLLSLRMRAAYSGCASSLALTLLFAADPSAAQFAAAVTPPRFEVSVAPGQVLRQVMEITHAVPGAGSYRVYSADWNMDASGALTFYDTLQPGSCRPWVAIERRDITVTHGARLRFRFEIAPPADTSARECRFALMVESRPQEVKSGETASFPMSGRIGVIVYASVGGAKAQLEPGMMSVGTFDGRRTPVLTVHNSGNATARLAGVVKGVDSAGATLEFSPESVPILPGQTRRIALHAFEAPQRRAAPGKGADAAATANIQWPLSLRGTLEYGLAGAGRIELDHRVGERLAE
jgi:hypothetical protein